MDYVQTASDELQIGKRRCRHQLVLHFSSSNLIGRKVSDFIVNYASQRSDLGLTSVSDVEVLNSRASDLV